MPRNVAIANTATKIAMASVGIGRRNLISSASGTETAAGRIASSSCHWFLQISPQRRGDARNFMKGFLASWRLSGEA